MKNGLNSQFWPDIVKEILTKSNGSFEKISLKPLARPLFGQGLAGLSGQKWVIHRRIANHAFNMERVKVTFFIHTKKEIVELV